MSNNRLIDPVTGDPYRAGEILGDVFDVVLSLDTSIFANGDVIADTQLISATAVRYNGGRATLQSLTVNDEDDQGTAIDLLFFSGNVSLGTENAAPSITDANARTYLGAVSVAAADFADLGGVRVASKAAIGLILKAAAGSQALYVAAVCRSGTPTYTASGVRLRLGLLQH